MATVVYGQEDTRFGSLGEGIGSIFGQIVGNRKEKRIEEEQRALVAELEKDLERAGTREEAVALPQNPRYAPLFKDIAAYRAFAKDIEAKFPKQPLSEFFTKDESGSFTSLGQYRERPSDEAVSKSEIAVNKPLSSSFIKVFRPGPGGHPIEEKQIRSGDPIPRGFVTKDFLQLQKESGTSKLYSLKDALRKEPGAIGFLSNRDIQLGGTPETEQEDIGLVSRATNVTDSRSIRERQINKEFNFKVDSKGDIIYDAIRGNDEEGDTSKAHLALSLSDELIFSGMKMGRAIGVASRVAKQIVPDKGGTLDLSQFQTINDNQMLSGRLARGKSLVVGKVYNTKDFGLLVYVGKKFGEEQFIPVEAGF